MAVATVHPSFLADLERLARLGRDRQPGSVERLRRAALDRFLAVGFPTRRDEAWRHTGLAPIIETAWELAPAGPATVDPRRWALPGAHVAVLVDGRFTPELSQLDGLPAGVTVASLADALERSPDTVEPWLGRQVGAAGHAFAALNTALLRDGVLVAADAGVVVSEPIQIVLLGGAAAGTVSVPRVLVVAGETAELTVIETYASAEGGPHLCCAATELELGQGARVDHSKVQDQDAASFHVAVQSARLERDATFSSHAFTFGAALARNDVAGRLDGEGASLVLNGLYLVSGDRHADTHMVVDHARPHGESHELYKGILDGRGSAVFDGLIHVHPGAQKTNAKQSNRNLLLSREAVANSNPQLRIFADDVKCTHGSTVGQLADEEIFYLRSRGIGRDEARAMLTWAFAGEVIAGVGPAALRARVEAALAARLPLGAVPEAGG